MRKISEYLHKDLFCFLEEPTRDDALEALVKQMYHTSIIEDKKAFHQAILHREHLVSTGIGLGVAIPHAKLPDIEDFSICVGIHKRKGLDWDAIDGSPVRIIFMIAGPDNRQTEYLQILSKLTVAIKHEPLRRSLLSAKNAQEAISMLAAY